ncbi:MAG: DNA/RNA non-specific endonuclease [Mangrovibacterium sp.]|nr:DNA/RNA non-specific endonuclease [Mangrovibacterium sp.]
MANHDPVSSGYSGEVSTAAFATTGTWEIRPFVQKQEEKEESDRGPPVQLKADHGTIQCSWFDDAFSTVTNFVAETLAEGKRFFLTEARDFVMAIPGYRALRVVLGEDPITGEEIDRNGHTFIEAAFDIMPGGRLLHEKLNELGALDEAAAWIDRRITDVELLVDNVLNRISQFVESVTLERLASPRQLFEEAGNIIHQTIQSIVDFAEEAATELLETVKRFLIDQLVTFIREQTPAYPLLRVILGKDPVTDEDVLQNGTTILDALLELGGEEGQEQRRQMQETGTFQKVAGWIDEGIAVFGGAYDEIKAGFLSIWSSVSINMLMHPIDTFNQIYNQFAAPVGRVLDFVIRAGAVILEFIKEVLMRRLSAWARTVRGYHLVTVIIGKDPFTNELVPFTMENVIRGFMSLMEGGDTQFDQLKESGAIDRTTAKITAAVERLNMTPAAIVQLFTDLWNSFSLNDLADPIGAFQRIIDRFGEPIARLVAFVVEIVRIVIETILMVMNFPFDLINNIIARAMQAFEMIKRDPVGFLKNLLRAIKQGFVQFFDNIVQHLLSGLVGWLTSELREAGVPALTDLSLRGVIGWVLEVLGISMEKIWEKLAAHPRIGPARVARIRSIINTLEGVWTFIRDVQERGIAAIWDKIQEQLSNLWDTILDAVKNWIMEQIVNRMVTRLLSMLDPTGIMAVVNSAIALYSAIQSFIKYLREMLEIVNSFVEGVVDIASGNIVTAANYLERTMARAVPIVIGFLANQVGLNGIGRRVGEMIGRAREMVDEALTWLVNKAVDTGFALFDRLMSMGGSAGDRSLEEQYGPEKAAQINAGLQAIETAEQPLLQSGKISEEEAQQVATSVKSNHPVFTSLTVVDGGDKWNYRYTASPPTIVTGKPKDTGLPDGVTLNVGDPILDKNSNTGYRIKELNVSTSVGFALRVEDSPTLFLYAQYGTRWEKPANKPPGVSFSSGGGPTANRTVRITVDNEIRKGGTRATIPASVAASIGYDTSGHWPRAGHLVANSLGGPGGYNSGNIVPMTIEANHTSQGMRGIEDAVLRDIIASDAVYDYSVAVTYSPSVQLPPVQVTVTAARLYPTTQLPQTVASQNTTIDNT